MIELIETVQGGMVIKHPPLVNNEPPTPSEIAQQTIDRLEQEQLLSRPVRDFMLTAMKDKADELGLTEEQLIAKNTLYRRVKQFDEQIAALRAQL